MPWWEWLTLVILPAVGAVLCVLGALQSWAIQRRVKKERGE